MRQQTQSGDLTNLAALHSSIHAVQGNGSDPSRAQRTEGAGPRERVRDPVLPVLPALYAFLRGLARGRALQAAARETMEASLTGAAGATALLPSP